MKIIDLFEDKVDSSWLNDISYKDGEIVIITNRNTYYKIPNITEIEFKRWFNAPSKGLYFHRYIKKNYDIERIL